MSKPLIVRAILNCKEDVFRDILIPGSSTLEDLHLEIVKAYDLENGQLASFYKTDDSWVQLEEIPLIAMDPKNIGSMGNFKCDDILGKAGARLIFVYDFLSMWTFMIEFIRFSENDVTNPEIVLKYGERPEKAPEPEFEGQGGFTAEDDDEEYGYDKEDLNDGFSSDGY